jgi:CxxC-x17-CxxC domain-containing protein
MSEELAKSRDMSDDTFEEVRESHSAGPDSEFNDLPIECIDCGEEFIWTAGAQAFFYDKGLAHPPKRCKLCKRAKVRRLAAVEQSRIDGKPASIKAQAVCAKCSQRTTVPFYPSQGRPVYCRACFNEAKSETAVGTNG